MVSEKIPPFAVRVGGVLLPKPLAGHPALELCNTLAGWREPPEHRNEWLTTPEHLAIWAEFTGLVTPRPRVTDTALNDVHELRAVAYRLLGLRDSTAFPALAEVADDAIARTRLTRADDGSVAFRLPPTDEPERLLYSKRLSHPKRLLHAESLPHPKQLLHAAALSVADLLGRPERLQVRACPGEGCGWLFLDPRGRRTWCTMAVCGNRAKVRAHAARRRSDGKP